MTYTKVCRTCKQVKSVKQFKRHASVCADCKRKTEDRKLLEVLKRYLTGLRLLKTRGRRNPNQSVSQYNLDAEIKAVEDKIYQLIRSN